MVVLGNPPYSNFGMMNKGAFILNLLKKYKKDLDEKKINLDDDFIKFIRWAQWRIALTGYGVLAFITSNTYIDGLTHRMMRKSLMEDFNEIYVLNLHGNNMRKEVSPDGSKDENIFDIQQGVAIGIYIRAHKKTEAEVYHADLWGLREDKYEYLATNNISTTKWKKTEPKAQNFFFVPRASDVEPEYDDYWPIGKIFIIHQSGLKTDRDKLFFDYDREELGNRIKIFYTESGLEPAFREKYDVRDSSSYKLISRRAKTNFDINNIHLCLYRPFDAQWLYYDPSLTSRPAWDVMQHMLTKNNLGLVFMRQVSVQDEYTHFLATRDLVDNRSFYSNKGIMSMAPVYLLENEQQLLIGPPKTNSVSRNRIPNLNPDFVSAFASRLGLDFVSDGHGDLATTFGPEDIFHYIYAVFHSPTYRQRYAEFLKIDFPRVPMTASPELFRKLCILGEELVALHLLESPYLSQLITRYPVVGDNIVEKGFPKFVAYEEGGPGYVYINKAQYFEGVPKEVWDFHVGGYQVCEKWLKDRRGRQLSFDDLMHYQKVRQGHTGLADGVDGQSNP